MAEKDKPYTPDVPAAMTDLQQLLQFIVNENQRIADALQRLGVTQGGFSSLTELSAEPTTKKDWDIVAADGEHWNPGQGRGIYFWLNGQWNLLSGVGEDPLPPPVIPPTTTPGAPVLTIQGFGSSATGGAGQSVVTVTNLNNSGAGSLREALASGNRRVQFSVGGVINLSSEIAVGGNNVTIEGLTAPAPGITLNNYGLSVSGRENVIVQGIRSDNAADDGLRCYNSKRVVFDHCSVRRFRDGALDITENSEDVTVQWCIFADGTPTHNFAMLISYEARRTSIHHNLFINIQDRQPNMNRTDTTVPTMSVLQADVRNNLVWNSKQRSTRVARGATANVIGNYYHGPVGDGNTVNVEGGSNGAAYTRDNFSHHGYNLNDNGNRSTEFAAEPVTTTDAKTAAHQVVANAGAQGTNFELDSYDKGLLAQISGLFSPTPTGPEDPPPPPPVQTEGYDWLHDFEDPNIWKIVDMTYGPYFIQARNNTRVTRINSVSRDGGWATRLLTEPTDTGISGSGDRKRCDLRLSQQYTDGYDGREYWWAHSVYLPSDYSFPAWRGLVLDFHHTGSTGSAPFNMGVQIENGVPKWRFTASAGPGVSAYSAWMDEAQKLEWVDFVYCIKWSTGSSGRTRIWFRKAAEASYRLILDRSGANMFSGMGVYLKVANYHDSPNRCAVIHDRIMRGQTPYSVAMAPLEGIPV